MPSVLYMAFPVATATNMFASLLQATEDQSAIAAPWRNVQVVPLVLVITLLSTKEDDTARNIPRSGDQHTHCHALCAGLAIDVQLIPLLLRMIRLLLAVVVDTATNIPSEADHATLLQLFPGMRRRVVQLIPLALVTTVSPVKPLATHTNR